MQLTSEPSHERPSDRWPALLERDVMAEEMFYELRAQLARLSETELAEFRAAPSNRQIIRRYDAYALRQVLPYIIPLVVVSVTSIVAGILLAA